MESTDRQKMSSAELRRKAGISLNTLTKLKKDEEVTLSILGKNALFLELISEKSLNVLMPI